MSPEQNRSRPAPHPVAALLTDEMKARVSAAKFERIDGFVRVDDPITPICPLGVAVGARSSSINLIFQGLGVDGKKASQRDLTSAVYSFIRWADHSQSDPADVYALLGCTDPQPPASTRGDDAPDGAQ